MRIDLGRQSAHSKFYRTEGISIALIDIAKQNRTIFDSKPKVYLHLSRFYDTFSDREALCNVNYFCQERGGLMDNQKFGQFISSLRKEKGWTQLELAEKLNVTDKAVSKWERGIGFPDIKMIEPLAEVLGVSILEIMSSEKMNQEPISVEYAAEAITNIVDVAAYQKKIERRNVLLTVILLSMIVLLVFLVDMMQWGGIVMVCLPVMMLIISTYFIGISIYNARQKHTYVRTLIIGVLALIYPVCILLLFYFAFVIGGPVPQ